VERERLQPGGLVLAVAVFGMLILLVVGNVRLYGLRQENQALENEIQEQEETIQQQRQWKQQALDLGLQTPEPQQTVILHLRGTMAP
jgi:type II secretory pathway pseudopilin PulG